MTNYKKGTKPGSPARTYNEACKRSEELGKPTTGNIVKVAWSDFIDKLWAKWESEDEKET